MVLAAALPIVGCGSPAAPSGATPPPTSHAAAASNPTVVTHATPTLPAANMFVAQAKGYWRRLGLHVSMPVSFLSPTTTVEEIVAGKIDIGETNADPATNNALLRGAPLTVLASSALVPPASRPNGFLLVDNALWQQGARGIQDLKGQTIGVFPDYSSASGRIVALLLKKGGLGIKDVHWQSWSNSSQMIQAFEAGTLKVAYVLDPQATLVRQKVKAHSLGNSGEVDAGDPVFFYFANSTWLKSNHEAAVRFLEGILEADAYYMKWLNSGFKSNADVLSITAKATHVPAAVIRSSGLTVFAPDGLFKVSQVRKDMAFLKTARAISQVGPWAQHTDLSYVKDAYQRLMKQGKP